MNLNWYILTINLLVPLPSSTGFKDNNNIENRTSKYYVIHANENEVEAEKEEASTERRGARTRDRCTTLKGLSPGQLKHCHLYDDHMETVAAGIRTSLNECEKQFKYQRWNCTLNPDHRTFFGPKFRIGNRESSYLQAITSAGIMHAVAKACKDGQLTRCGCSTLPRPRDLYKEWLWRGCSDNLEYAYKFTKNMVDVREQEKIHIFKKTHREYSRALMNLHNNEAGRRAVLKQTKITCKCHGVSGSCSMITCWHQLPAFAEIGDYIAEKYRSAAKAEQNKRGRLQVRNANGKRSTVTDLVYVHASPDFCEPNQTYGLLGTQNRECSLESNQTTGTCEELCCGRGYNARKLFTKEKCNCKFQWCCYVKCDYCISPKELTFCK